MQCPHTGERQSRYVIEDVVHVLCASCRSSWGKHSQEALSYPPPVVDNAALAEAYHDLGLIREELAWTAERETELRHVLRAELRWVHDTFRVSWRDIGLALGVTRHAIEKYVRWNNGEYVYGNPYSLKNEVNRRRAFRTAQQRRHRARVKERLANSEEEV